MKTKIFSRGKEEYDSYRKKNNRRMNQINIGEVYNKIYNKNSIN